MRKPKPRKVQKYPEFWHRSDVDTIYFVPLPPHLPKYFNIYDRSGFEYNQWLKTSFCSAIFRLKGKKREGWGKFEFIGEIKP